MTTRSNSAEEATPARDKRTVVIAWIALSAMTIAAWRLTPGHSGDSAAAGRALVAIIVILGAVKCRLIIRYFMEIRAAPRWLRLTTDAWLIVLWAGLLGVYLY